MRPFIVVTGGTKGIGKAVNWHFAHQGFDIITCARNAEALAQEQAALQKAFPEQQFEAHVADMQNTEAVKDFAALVENLNRPIDVLVNNAGVFLPGSVLDEPEGHLERMIETNLYSAYYMARAMGRLMRDQKRGHIFNVSSIAGIMAYANGGSYAISKHAMQGLGKVLRQELLEHNVRVTNVLPGATYTASWEGADVPEERLMPAEDVAAAIWGAYAMSQRTVVEELIMRPQLGDL